MRDRDSTEFAAMRYVKGVTGMPAGRRRRGVVRRVLVL